MSIFEEKRGKTLPKIIESTNILPPVHLKVLQEKAFTSNSDITESNIYNDSQPDRPFAEQMYIIDHDSRLQLSEETYIQMVFGSGIAVKSEKKRLVTKIKDWFDEINFEQKIEDGLPSYLGVGNLLLEVEPKTLSDFVEIPISTIKSIVRNKKGKVSNYIQYVNNMQKELPPDNIKHLKLTNSQREVWGRGLYHAIINKFTDPTTGEVYDAPIFAMKKAEDGITRIIQNYSSPTQMFYFEDAGENFIEKQADDLRKARPGAKILTDKKFEVETFEVEGNNKFDGYIEHMQKNILEPGIQFPLGFFNAAFTARAASETSDSVMIRKVKRIQRRLAHQLKEQIILPYLRKTDKSIKESDFDISFEFDEKIDFDINQLVVLFRDNGIRRSELRQNISKKTNLDINLDDMEDELPITSVTPTDRFGASTSPPENQPVKIPQRDKTRPELKQNQESKVEEPFGPFKDFDACTSHFTGKGDSIGVAKKKCGAIMKRLEKTVNEFEDN